MTTTLSSKGQAVLTPKHPRRLVREYATDPQTGLRVTKPPDQTEPVTTEMVNTLLEDYP